jgi:hypothetical protein
LSFVDVLDGVAAVLYAAVRCSQRALKSDLENFPLRFLVTLPPFVGFSGVMLVGCIVPIVAALLGEFLGVK